MESRRNQVLSTLFNRFVSSSDDQLSKNRRCFCGTCQDCFQLQTLAKIFAFFSIEQSQIARLVLRLLKIESPYPIAIDRAEWQFGKRWVNILVLSVTYGNLSIPLFWTVLDEKGCSDEAERRALLETLFGVLKTRGFRLEDTHLTETERVSKLLSFLTIAVSWAMLAGELEVVDKPLKIKKHGYLEKSIFRLGFEVLGNCFCQITANLRQKQRF